MDGRERSNDVVQKVVDVDRLRGTISSVEYSKYVCDLRVCESRAEQAPRALGPAAAGGSRSRRCSFRPAPRARWQSQKSKTPHGSPRESTMWRWAADVVPQGGRSRAVWRAVARLARHGRSDPFLACRRPSCLNGELSIGSGGRRVHGPLHGAARPLPCAAEDFQRAASSST